MKNTRLVNWKFLCIPVILFLLTIPLSAFPNGITPEIIKSMVENLSPEFKTPKQQTNVGILPSEVQCKEGLELIFKSTDGSPACVKPKTAEKLIERGWGIMINPDGRTWVEIEPIRCIVENLCNIEWLESYYNATTLQTAPLANLRGADYEQTTAFIKDYYKKQGIDVFDVRYDLVLRSVCELYECWDRYNLSLLVSESDVDSMVKIGYKVAN